MKNIRLSLLSVFGLLSLILQAQDVKPTFQTLEFDLIARTKPRLDINEIPCAVLRVSAAEIKGYEFEGNIIGDIVYSPGEALIYMTDNSRALTIKSDRFGSMKYEFPERLKKQVAYKLSLKVESAETPTHSDSWTSTMEESKKQLGKRSTKTARQEAKQFKKEGWKTTPGTMPIDKQLDKSYAIQQQYNDKFESVYLMGQASSIAPTYDMARMQAMELAKIEMAGLIESNISSKTESAITNKRLSAEEAESIVSVVQTSRNSVMQRLGKMIVVIELYRDVKKGKEVLVRLAYNTEQSQKEAIEAIRCQLELSPEWGEKLGNILEGR